MTSAPRNATALCILMASVPATALAQNAPEATPRSQASGESGEAPPQPPQPKARFDVQLGDEALAAEHPEDEPLVRGGMYDRPYLARVGTSTADAAIGGYAEVNGNYLVEEGLTEGFSFEMRRFNLFVTSQIADAVRLTSELEFEHGTEEIELETALADVMFHHTVNLRAGVLLVPIGKFNIAHDSPLYDVIDRPLVSTRIIPATLSEVGFGLFGAFYLGGGNRLTYEAYVVNGLSDGVIADEGTRISEGKGAERFEEDDNGTPAFAGRIAFNSSASGFVKGELGASIYTGIYNTHTIEGDDIDDPRWLRILALDAETTIGPATVRGELAYANVDVPPDLTALHAREQFGFYVEAGYQFFELPLGPFDKASLAGVVRVDHVDLNADARQLSDDTNGDETTRLTVGPSFRPDPATSIRVVYRHDWMTDFLNNPARGGGIQFGVATYF